MTMTINPPRPCPPRPSRVFAAAVLAAALLALLPPPAALASEKDLRVDAIRNDSNGPLGKIDELYEMGSTLWFVARVAGVRKLYCWEIDKEPAPKHFEDCRPWNESVRQLGEVSVTALTGRGSVLWIGTSGGTIYSFETDPRGGPADPTLYEVDSLNGVNALYWQDSTLWIGMDEGVFKLEAGAPKPARVNVDIPEPSGEREGSSPNGRKVRAIYGVGSKLLLGTYKNLYQWKDTSSPLLEMVALPGVFSEDEFPDGGDIRINALVVVKVGERSSLFVASDRGLHRFRVERDSLVEPKQIFIDPETVKSLHCSASSLWIGTDHWVYRVRGVGREWSGHIDPKISPESVRPGEDILLRWEIPDYGGRTTAQLVEQEITVYGPNGEKLSQIDDRGLEQAFRVALPPIPNEGNYRVEVTARDLTGTVLPGKREFTVSPRERSAAWWIRTTGLTYTVAGGLLFAVLLVASRWHQKPFEIMTDPVIRTLGLYYGFVLRHVPPVRVWVFERYFKNLKARHHKELKYLPAPVLPPDERESPLLTTEMFGELSKHRHVCLVGGPGTGKTDLVNNLLLEYCREPTLRKAWKKYGFIPIVVHVRDTSKDKIPHLAADALESLGMPFDKDSFFDKLLRQGGFLLILDGINEGDIDEEVKRFSSVASVRMLLTSQRPLDASNIPHYVLPGFTPDFSRELLKLYLGKDAGLDAADKLGEGLLDEINSGYDVKLIVDLVKRGQPLPRKRIQLFESIVRYTRQLKPDYPQDQVCRKAWRLWLDGERKFAPDQTLLDDHLRLLRDANIVAQHQDGYTFRHDQMRDYLAASWAVKHVRSPEGVKTRLMDRGRGDNTIWDLSVQDQRNVFQFLAEMIVEKDDWALLPEELNANGVAGPDSPRPAARKKFVALLTVSQFAAEEFKQRLELLDALKAVAEKNDWPLNVQLVGNQVAA